MLDIHGVCVGILSGLTDGDRWVLKKNLERGHECYKKAVPNAYYSAFLEELKKILGVLPNE